MMMMPDRRLENPNQQDEIYDDYVADTVDPGQTLFIVAIALCVGSLLCLPLCMKIYRKFVPKRTSLKGGAKKQGRQQDEEEEEAGVLDSYINEVHPPHVPESDLTNTQFCQKTGLTTLQFILEKGSAVKKKSHSSKRSIAVAREETRESTSLAEIWSSCDPNTTTLRDDNDDDGDYRPPMMPPSALYDAPPVSSGTPPPAMPHRDDDVYPAETPTMTFSDSVAYYRGLWTKILAWDNETRQLSRLIIPFTISAVTYSVSNLVTVALISHALGTDDMIAFVMVDAVVGIGSSFAGGALEAVSSLGSMAYGAGNYELVGQYVRTSCVLYVLCELPLAWLWSTQMSNIVRWIGYDDYVARLAHDFVWVQLAINVVSGVNQSLLDFLEVVGKEAYSNLVYCLSSVIQVGLVAVVAIMTDANLITLGLVMVASEAVFCLVGILIPYRMGWLTSFKLGSCSWNPAVLKQLSKTALPLSFGGLLAYAEWEILIVFAAILGPAEAATWTIIGFVWDLFESTTGAIGDASELRCAFQLGKGRPELARLSAYKSMFLAFVMSVVASSIFLGLGNDLPRWLTHDPTIQAMLAELIPLIALGNVTMVMGMVCWSLIGGQGRYRLATSIATACSLLVTLPLAALFTLWLRIDLQGLTFAVVIGYTATAMLMATVLLMSDWERRSFKIGEKMAADEEDSDTDSDRTDQVNSPTGPSVGNNLPDIHDEYQALEMASMPETKANQDHSYAGPRIENNLPRMHNEYQAPQMASASEKQVDPFNEVQNPKSVGGISGSPAEELKSGIQPVLCNSVDSVTGDGYSGGVLEHKIDQEHSYAGQCIENNLLGMHNEYQGLEITSVPEEQVDPFNDVFGSKSVGGISGSPTDEPKSGIQPAFCNSTEHDKGDADRGGDEMKGGKCEADQGSSCTSPPIADSIPKIETHLCRSGDVMVMTGRQSSFSSQ